MLSISPGPLLINILRFYLDSISSKNFFNDLLSGKLFGFNFDLKYSIQFFFEFGIECEIGKYICYILTVEHVLNQQERDRITLNGVGCVK